MDYKLIAFMVATVCLYAVVARIERRNPGVWMAASVAVWTLSIFVFRFGMLGCLTMQVVPYAAMFALNLRQGPRA